MKMDHTPQLAMAVEGVVLVAVGLETQSLTLS